MIMSGYIVKLKVKVNKNFTIMRFVRRGHLGFFIKLYLLNPQPKAVGQTIP